MTQLQVLPEVSEATVLHGLPPEELRQFTFKIFQELLFSTGFQKSHHLEDTNSISFYMYQPNREFNPNPVWSISEDLGSNCWVSLRDKGLTKGKKKWFLLLYESSISPSLWASFLKDSSTAEVLWDPVSATLSLRKSVVICVTAFVIHNSNCFSLEIYSTKGVIFYVCWDLE